MSQFDIEPAIQSNKGSQDEVPDIVQCRVCVPRGAGNICFIGECIFSGGQHRHEQTQQAVCRECPQSSVFTWNLEKNDAVGEMNKKFR